MTTSHSAFFYGTLMHPKILAKVIQSTGAHLKIAPAVLLGYTRHVVKGETYPGVVPIARSKELFDPSRVLTREDTCVRGTVVTGLTIEDMRLLDQFEGNEYTRESIEVHLLAEGKNLSVGIKDNELIPTHPPAIPEEGSLQGGVQAETYIYVNIHNLVPELWSFEDFVKRNAWKWYGRIPSGNAVEERCLRPEQLPREERIWVDQDPLTFRYE